MFKPAMRGEASRSGPPRVLVVEDLDIATDVARKIERDWARIVTLNGELVVPTGAVFQRGAATIVYVAARGTVESRPVTVLRRGRDQIAIASGVMEGERVALKEPEQENGAR